MGAFGSAVPMHGLHFQPRINQLEDCHSARTTLAVLLLLVVVLLQQQPPVEAEFVERTSAGSATDSSGAHILLEPEAFRDHFVEGWPGPYSNVRLASAMPVVVY